MTILRSQTSGPEKAASGTNPNIAWFSVDCAGYSKREIVRKIVEEREFNGFRQAGWPHPPHSTFNLNVLCNYFKSIFPLELQ
jgi:hypothetical protein